jgi:hypothetical protein
MPPRFANKGVPDAPEVGAVGWEHRGPEAPEVGAVGWEHRAKATAGPRAPNRTSSQSLERTWIWIELFFNKLCFFFWLLLFRVSESP